MGDTQIGAYRVLHQIGQGGMGTVWLAEHSMLGRRAAIKVLNPEFSRQTEIVTRFFNEARAATAVSDPGIVQIFDFGHHTDGSAYIVMELLEGEPLDKRIARCGALPVLDALRIMRQIASTLGAAHARGIVHRDLKPENIYLVRDPEVAGGERAKILDFGIAKLVGDPSMKTQTSAVMGTPTYMSPEQCRGAGQVDQRSDVYALGCLLFALVTGRPPFEAEGIGEIIAMHLREPAPVPSQRRPGIPPELDHIILTCLAKNPNERFASASDLAIAIGALLGSAPHLATVVPPSASRPYPAPSVPTTLSSAVGLAAPGAKSSTRGFLIAGVAIVVVAGGAIAAVVATGGGDTKTAAAPPEPVKPEPPKPEPVKPEPPKPEPPKADPNAEVTARMKDALQKFVAWAKDHAGAPCPELSALGVTASDLKLTCTDQPGDQIVGIVAQGGIASWQLGRDVTDLVKGPRWVVKAVAATKPVKPPPAKKPPEPVKPPPAKPRPTSVELDENGMPISR